MTEHARFHIFLSLRKRPIPTSHRDKKPASVAHFSRLGHTSEIWKHHADGQMHTLHTKRIERKNQKKSFFFFFFFFFFYFFFQSKSKKKGLHLVRSSTSSLFDERILCGLPKAALHLRCKFSSGDEWLGFNYWSSCNGVSSFWSWKLGTMLLSEWARERVQRRKILLWKVRNRLL